MKGRADIVSTIHHLKMSVMHMDSFINERETAALTRLFKSYKGKIEWIFNDIKSEPLMPQIVRDGINQELNSDVLAVPAINDKIALLPPSKREVIELLIDKILDGEEIKILNEDTICG